MSFVIGGVIGPTLSFSFGFIMMDFDLKSG